MFRFAQQDTFGVSHSSVIRVWERTPERPRRGTGAIFGWTAMVEVAACREGRAGFGALFLEPREHDRFDSVWCMSVNWSEHSALQRELLARVNDRDDS